MFGGLLAGLGGGLFSAGGSLLGGLFGGGSSRNPYQGMYDQAGQLSDELRALLSKRFNDSEKMLAARTTEVMNDYNRAESAIGQVGRQAKQDILDREKQQLSGTAASMQQRGLYNTTALDSANRGVYADTTRSLNNLNEGLAGLRSSAAARTGQARSNLLGDQANLPLTRFSAESNTLQSIIQNLLRQAGQGTESWQAGRAANAQAWGNLGGQAGGALFNLLGGLFK